MPWNGSGTFSRTNGDHTGATLWAEDDAEDIKITSPRHDAHDQDLCTGLNECLTKSGQNSPTANIPMAGYKFTGLGNGTAAADSPAIQQIQDGTFLWGGTSTGAANVYAITLSPATDAVPATGQCVYFKAHQSNSGAATLAINGGSAAAIKKNVANALELYDIVQNRVIGCCYDGTNWLLIAEEKESYGSYVPTLGVSGGTWGSTSITYAVTGVRSGMVYVFIEATGTAGTTPSYITATTVYTAQTGAVFPLTCTYYDESGTPVFVGHAAVSGTTITVYPYWFDGSGWVGTFADGTLTVRINGWYKLNN
jgi:hypothetical protein